jgi:hypothetical protein
MFRSYDHLQAETPEPDLIHTKLEIKRHLISSEVDITSQKVTPVSVFSLGNLKKNKT